SNGSQFIRTVIDSYFSGMTDSLSGIVAIAFSYAAIGKVGVAVEPVAHIVRPSEIIVTIVIKAFVAIIQIKSAIIVMIRSARYVNHAIQSSPDVLFQNNIDNSRLTFRIVF